jgi:hypothetical protein
MFFSGGAMFVAATVYDIATVGRHADAYNKAHRIKIAPVVGIDRGATSTGVMVSGSF